MNNLHKQGEWESERMYESVANNSHLTQTQFWFSLHPLYGGSLLKYRWLWWPWYKPKIFLSSLMLFFIAPSVYLACKHKPIYSCQCDLRHITSKAQLSLSFLFPFSCLWKARHLTMFDRCNYGLAIICTVALHAPYPFVSAKVRCVIGRDENWYNCHSVCLLLCFGTARHSDPYTGNPESVFGVY